MNELNKKEDQHSIDVKNRIFHTRFLIQNPDGPDILTRSLVNLSANTDIKRAGKNRDRHTDRWKQTGPRP